MSDNSGPAFPLPGISDSRYLPGLTKRELFAMVAMQGLLSNLADLRREGLRNHEIEQFAVMRADALIAELKK